MFAFLVCATFVTAADTEAEADVSSSKHGYKVLPNTFGGPGFVYSFNHLIGKREVKPATEDDASIRHVKYGYAHSASSGYGLTYPTQYRNHLIGKREVKPATEVDASMRSLATPKSTPC